ncbi:carbamoyltransferase C-terminal domain-containing protein [Rhodocytophaga aerolata]|uniref:Carbamoyltransferase C-terminal domain-containing protein n=1 Tax=Rhodocytophaga aerolata TaxID=455078 RepID=A0ABT8RCL3_9BACT|nr:carbamoyltransferase C-terminal domain-containing protein [Rhodocytophaga aerolata]MDO1449805.1 carbamoyltransferase C-terminal domain-containing protein [Rhodocytophaga aerolata]
MYILGLNAFHGDSSACIYKNGELIVASEEERFRRIKHWAGFPSEAIKFCLNEAQISIKDVVHITLSRDPNANVTRKMLHLVKKGVSLGNLIDRIQNRNKISSVKLQLAEALGVEEKEIKAEIHNIEHHRSHMASAFFASPFEESAILSVDGFGDFTSTMIGVGKGNKIEVLDSVTYPHSLGIFYTTFTQFLGFPYYGDEYKVMGLAPYGKPLYVDKLKDVIKFTENGFFSLNEKYFLHPTQGVKMSWEDGIPDIDKLYSPYLIAKFGNPRHKEDSLTDEHRNLAASVQKITEDVIFYMLDHLHKQTSIDNICITGGVAQNSVANGKILSSTPFKKIYIPPAGHDAGTSIGSALYLYNHLLDQPRTLPMYNPYTGSKYTVDVIEQLLLKHKIVYKRLNDAELYDQVTNCLIEGGVVGWFQGRAEFGPRALGHRSILADPRRNDVKEILNLKIKRRESFRPFAPSILKEYVSEYFEQVDDVPFMEKVFLIKQDKRKDIPAVTHVDGTGRLQSVDKNVEPKYYNLINEFKNKTGIPVLVNTSFNENEPIVNSPQQALDCFLRTKMDMLVMENILIKRD